MKTILAVLILAAASLGFNLPYDTTVRLTNESVYIQYFNVTLNYHLTATLSCPKYWYQGDFNFYRIGSDSPHPIVKVKGSNLPLSSGSLCCQPPELSCKPDSATFNNDSIVYAFAFQYDTIYFRVDSMDSRLYAKLHFYSQRTMRTVARLPVHSYVRTVTMKQWYFINGRAFPGDPAHTEALPKEVWRQREGRPFIYFQK